MAVDVIVLNGASSSGKSSLAPYLQRGLPGRWFVLGVDDLIRALSFGPTDTTAGGTVHITADGSVTVTDEFRQAERVWRQAIVAVAENGIGVILDDVLLDGGHSQARVAESIGHLSVVWVGIRCDLEVAADREVLRGDRVPGMNRHQALRVHEGVTYDVEVDTTTRSSEACANDIIEYVTMQRYP
jgi:chloramphenicol 3-O phosphotransferase